MVFGSFSGSDEGFVFFIYCFKKNDEKKETGFLFCYGIGNGKRISPGVTETENQRLVTLRETLPYQALRPHVQQAYVMIDTRLIVPKPLIRDEFLNLFDYSEFVLFALEIPQETLKMMFETSSPNFFNKCQNLFPNKENDLIFSLLKDFEKNLQKSTASLY